MHQTIEHQKLRGVSDASKDLAQSLTTLARIDTASSPVDGDSVAHGELWEGFLHGAN